MIFYYIPNLLFVLTACTSWRSAYQKRWTCSITVVLLVHHSLASPKAENMSVDHEISSKGRQLCGWWFVIWLWVDSPNNENTRIETWTMVRFLRRPLILVTAFGHFTVRTTWGDCISWELLLRTLSCAHQLHWFLQRSVLIYCRMWHLLATVHFLKTQTKLIIVTVDSLSYVRSYLTCGKHTTHYLHTKKVKLLCFLL
jgi:hypothetical protein